MWKRKLIRSGVKNSIVIVVDEMLWIVCGVVMFFFGVVWKVSEAYSRCNLQPSMVIAMSPQ